MRMQLGVLVVVVVTVVMTVGLFLTLGLLSWLRGTLMKPSIIYISNCTSRRNKQ